MFTYEDSAEITFRAGDADTALEAFLSGEDFGRLDADEIGYSDDLDNDADDYAA